MAQEAPNPNPSLIPPQPIPEGASDFSERVRGLMDGQPKDDATVAKALEGMDSVVDRIAAGLYTIASMLVGEGEDSVRLVETAIANTAVSACENPIEGRRLCRLALCEAAIELLAKRNPGSLTAPEAPPPSGGCIDDDELDAAGTSREEFERMATGPDRYRVRDWLAKLPADQRTVFALRASAGFTGRETSALLAAHGGQQAAGWTPEAVREVFRQALCSLASQLLQASVPGARS